ncbi:MAG: hypothetical protein ACLT9P_06000 [Evtepia gabavorous]
MKSPDWLRILTASPAQRLPGGVQLRLLICPGGSGGPAGGDGAGGGGQRPARCAPTPAWWPGRWFAGGVRCMGPGRRFCTG